MLEDVWTQTSIETSSFGSDFVEGTLDGVSDLVGELWGLSEVRHLPDGGNLEWVGHNGTDSTGDGSDDSLLSVGQVIWGSNRDYS